MPSFRQARRTGPSLSADLMSTFALGQVQVRRGSVRPELAVITVSRYHLILVIRSPGELADLEHVQAEPLDLCEHGV